MDGWARILSTEPHMNEAIVVSPGTLDAFGSQVYYVRTTGACAACVVPHPNWISPFKW